MYVDDEGEKRAALDVSRTAHKGVQAGTEERNLCKNRIRCTRSRRTRCSRYLQQSRGVRRNGAEEMHEDGTKRGVWTVEFFVRCRVGMSSVKTEATV